MVYLRNAKNSTRNFSEIYETCAGADVRDWNIEQSVIMRLHEKGICI